MKNKNIASEAGNRETIKEKRLRVSKSRPGFCTRCPFHDNENKRRIPKPDKYKTSRKGR